MGDDAAGGHDPPWISPRPADERPLDRGAPATWRRYPTQTRNATTEALPRKRRRDPASVNAAVRRRRPRTTGRAAAYPEPELLERRLQALGARAHVLVDRVDRHVGVLGDLVGRADAREVLQLAGAGARVQALRVALLGDLDRRVDVDLEERQPRRLVQLARERAVVVRGGDERGDRDHARVGHQARHVRGAADVLGAVRRREREVAREAVAQVVAVEEVRRVAVLDEDALQLGRDRRLARGGQAREPDGRAARAERVPAMVALEPALVPRDAGRMLRRAAALAHPPHHAGGDGVVGVLVDQDEGAGGAVLGVRVGDDRRGRAQRDARDVVERELVRRRAVASASSRRAARRSTRPRRAPCGSCA